MQSVRNCFDCLISLFPTFEGHLGPKADIVHCPDFESGAIKVINGQGNLSRAEKIALQMFEIGPNQAGWPLLLQMWVKQVI